MRTPFLLSPKYIHVLLMLSLSKCFEFLCTTLLVHKVATLVVSRWKKQRRWNYLLEAQRERTKIAYNFCRRIAQTSAKIKLSSTLRGVYFERLCVRLYSYTKCLWTEVYFGLYTKFIHLSSFLQHVPVRNQRGHNGQRHWSPVFTNTSRERASQLLPLHIRSLSISVFLCRVHVAFVPRIKK